MCVVAKTVLYDVAATIVVVILPMVYMAMAKESNDVWLFQRGGVVLRLQWQPMVMACVALHGYYGSIVWRIMVH